MAITQKPVYTTSEIRRQLRESNRSGYGERTWGNMYGMASVSAEKAQSALQTSYREAVAGAYDSYLKNKMAITSSNLIGESQNTLLKEQQIALTDAYDSYRSNLEKGESQIMQSYREQIASIDEALNTQTQYTTDYMNTFGDYYTYLTDTYGDELIKDKLWDTRYGIDVQEDGSNVHRLSTWDELRSRMYDENGELTRFGIDVIDQLENAQIGQIVNDELLPNWEDYLYSQNDELYEWAFNTANPYNWTEAGTNVGTIKAMTGRLSTDQEYSFLERWGGLTEEQTDKIFGKFVEKVNAFKSLGQEEKRNIGKNIVGDVADAIDEFSKFASDLGIDTELEQVFIDAGMSGGFKALQEDLKRYQNGTLTMKQMTNKWFGKFIPGEVAGASAAVATTSASTVLTTEIGSTLLGSGLAAGVAEALPIVGAVLAIGFIAMSIIDASMDTHEQRKENERMADSAIQLYQQVINQSIAYGRSKAQEAEQKYMLK